MNKTILKASGNGKLKISELEHPNQMPFSGVLTYLNRLSTEPPHGSNGLRVFIPLEVGAPAVASLKGMAVNYIEGNPVGHDPKAKVGVITDAKLGETQPDGAVPILIEGYVYALDFEEAANSIKASQSLLGFSYETAQTQLVKGEIDGIPAAIVTSLGYFTGASILYRDSASYADTSLAASKENKEVNDSDMNEKLEKMLQTMLEGINSLKDYVDQRLDQFQEVLEKQDINEKVEDLREAGEPDEEGGIQASAEPTVEPKAEEPKAQDAAPVVEPVKEDVKENVAATDQEVKPENAAPAEPVAERPKAEEPKPEDAQLNASSLLAEIKSLKDELASLKQEASIQASARKSVAYPTTAIAKYGIEETDDKTKLMASIEARTDLDVTERLQMKLEALSKLDKQN